MTKAAFSVRIKNGSFYLSAELYGELFERTSGVAVMLREGRIALVPLRQPGSGGLLVKLLNARGDRVIHAQEFLRELELADGEQHELSAEWDPELSGLTLPNPKMSTGEPPSPALSRALR